MPRRQVVQIRGACLGIEPRGILADADGVGIIKNPKTHYPLRIYFGSVQITQRETRIAVKGSREMMPLAVIDGIGRAGGVYIDGVEIHKIPLPSARLEGGGERKARIMSRIGGVSEEWQVAVGRAGHLLHPEGDGKTVRAKLQVSRFAQSDVIGIGHLAQSIRLRVIVKRLPNPSRDKSWGADRRAVVAVT